MDLDPAKFSGSTVDPEQGEYFEDGFIPLDKIRINLLKAANKLVTLERDQAWEANRHDQKFPMYLTEQAWSEDIETRRNSRQTIGVIFMDFDNFKDVNDVLGHLVGDELIRSFGEEMNEAFRREGDSIGIARWGGDEFCISFRIDDDERRATDVEERVKRTREYLKRCIRLFIDKQPHRDELIKLGFGVSFGIVVDDSQDMKLFSQLQEEMDADMYRDKHTKSGNLGWPQ
jgi:diguanylate cyclase (GGDEF)-like protein